MEVTNHINLRGIEFIEFASPHPEHLDQLFLEFGFSKLKQHEALSIDFYKQNDIHFLVNKTPQSFAEQFYKAHGPSCCSMGWRVDDAEEALRVAVERGAAHYPDADIVTKEGKRVPAILGIGDSLIYLIDNFEAPDLYEQLGFTDLAEPEVRQEKGFLLIDHLTNNVPQGTMQKWANFYKEIFGFYEVKYFDIRGAKTGLLSYALKSPDGSFCIPINEGTEAKSQINEYLREYKGAGIQHIAFLSKDLLSSLEQLQEASIETLDIDDEYYQEVFTRVPNVKEDHKRIQDLNVLVDGDDEGYLLQIFTKNLIGPIFIEMIQRENHYAFGEGNFGALFRSIERDQQRRGVL